MTDAFSLPIQVNGYHAHVYYDASTRPAAERLAEAIGNNFRVEFGGFQDGPLGPHPIANLQLIFTTQSSRTSCPG